MSENIINNAYVMPINVSRDTIYPWEDINLSLFAKKLFLIAQKNGYKDSWESFRQCLIDLQNGQTLSNDFQEYLGSYRIIPMVDTAQILSTNKTFLLANITVEPIPYYETSNDKGGYTVYIGE